MLPPRVIIASLQIEHVPYHWKVESLAFTPIQQGADLLLEIWCEEGEVVLEYKAKVEILLDDPSPGSSMA
jgi:hypothetical protein